MRHRRIRRFRNRPNGRSHHQRPNGDQGKFAGLNFPNDRGRNNFRSSQSMEKLIERYNSLAKEALSTGDKILSENYLQHADHFVRIIDDRNSKNINQTTENKDSTNSDNKSPKVELVEEKK